MCAHNKWGAREHREGHTAGGSAHDTEKPTQQLLLTKQRPAASRSHELAGQHTLEPAVNAGCNGRSRRVNTTQASSYLGPQLLLPLLVSCHFHPSPAWHHLLPPPWLLERRHIRSGQWKKGNQRLFAFRKDGRREPCVIKKRCLKGQLFAAADKHVYQ